MLSANYIFIVEMRMTQMNTSKVNEYRNLVGDIDFIFVIVLKREFIFPI
jgi:hypothetical protein